MSDASLESADTIAEWGDYEFYVPLKGQQKEGDLNRNSSQGFSVNGRKTATHWVVAESQLLHMIAQVESTLLWPNKTAWPSAS